MTDRASTIGFIGLGAMGQPMAMNIARANLPLLVFDIAASRAAPVLELGAQWVDSCASLACKAGVFVSMVDTVEQNEQVLFGEEGLLKAAQSGDLFVAMSTMAPEAARSFRDRLAGRGISMIDAPVTGFIEGAIKGTLHAYVGGESDALERARPVLAATTEEIIHVGEVGQGSILKLVNNMLAQANRILVIEAMVMAKAAGLDPQMVIDTVSRSSGNSVVFQHAAPRLLSRDFTGIRMDITIKDLEMQRQIAKSLNVPLFMANTAQQVYMMAKAAGYGSEDPAAVVKVYEQLVGISLARS